MKQTPFEESRFYHVYNRGNNKENIFIEEKNYIFFLQKLKQHLLPICRIYAYCLLPNHFHFVLQIKDLDSILEEYQARRKKLSQPFSNFFNSYTKSINKSYQRSGSLFQEHLHRNEVDFEVYLRDLIIYVLLNPVNHGFVNNFKEYKFSSFQALISRKKTDIMRKEVVGFI